MGLTYTKIYAFLKIHIYLFGFVGSDLQHAGSPSCHVGSFVAAHQFSWCGCGFSSHGTQAPECVGFTSSSPWALQLWHIGSVAPQHVRSQFSDQGSNSQPALYSGFLSIGPPVHFSRSVVSDSLWSHGLQHVRLPCPSPTPRGCSDSCSLSQWCHPTISSSIIPFSSYLHQGISQGVSSSHQVAKVLEFQLQHQSFQWVFKTEFL